MPTPFNHLHIAYDLTAQLPAALRAPLAAEWPAFLLGNIAPDVQTLTGELREATHFFPVPLGAAPPAAAALFAQHPALAQPGRMAPGQAAFVAGYLVHLEFDQWWVRDIFEPVFGPDLAWGTFPERLYLHNALRAYWDAEDLAALSGEAGVQLSRAAPAGWLPCGRHADLARWRDEVADQLLAGPVAGRTLAVFAERMQVEAEVFSRLVQSPEAMARQVFARVPLAEVRAYRQRTLAHSAALLDAYWAGRLRPHRS